MTLTYAAIAPYVAPLLDAAKDPMLVGSAIFVGAMTLAYQMQRSSNAKVRRVGQLIQSGGGIAYKALSLAAAANLTTALSPAEIATLERTAIAQGMAAIKVAAAADAKSLPSTTELALHVASVMGTQPGYPAVVASLATAAPSVADSAATAAMVANAPVLAATAEKATATAETAISLAETAVGVAETLAAKA